MSKVCFNCLYRVAQKERMFFNLPAISFFGVTSNQKSVPQEMLVNVMQNFEERLRTCLRQEGRHLSDIIFRN